MLVYALLRSTPRETFILGLKSVDFLIGVEFKRQLGAPAQ